VKSDLFKKTLIAWFQHSLNPKNKLHGNACMARHAKNNHSHNNHGAPNHACKNKTPFPCFPQAIHRNAYICALKTLSNERNIKVQRH